MNDLLIIGFRTVFLYFVILIIFRLMGKREVGELSMIDLVIFVLIAEVAAFAIDDPQRKLFESVLPMIMLLVIQVVLSFITLKNKKIRDLIDGGPVTIIRDGVIMEKEMRRLRYNLNDLFQQLREQQVGSVQQVAYAFLEPSGNLSVFVKNEDTPVLPYIVDGEVQNRNLQLTQRTEEWLREKLLEQGITDITEIFYCCFEENELHIQKKEAAS
ncbi:DUF421 domain-containing protein [Viridibacillus sp. FSL R5-0477]|uniref:YetF C-terminal domain-containing protein n=1 Tax=Viridibacillus arenosi FSL R5-213 TaxID=1227360 RepID=W4EQZ6_9BACL|nr:MULTISPECIES: DUF421 domain-containing protein [Viridibacillus]ETT82437.1 hypothetical protein C176_15642 [Viridibacillus arenosi FSL R5-213]OMC85414.1 DUF421 domain-containing protein [Viridibacillus sp. FSL H8-0123]OMC87308.1 DUF421 domain-containing protein [Viridibacillus sp. FSL H7-0596]OMC92469.1 DUF421 domain-containing protein [Viridibacillus arenosi]